MSLSAGGLEHNTDHNAYEFDFGPSSTIPGKRIVNPGCGAAESPEPIDAAICSARLDLLSPNDNTDTFFATALGGQRTFTNDAHAGAAATFKPSASPGLSIAPEMTWTTTA